LAFEKIPSESLEIANQYKKALDDFFRTYDPELYAAEYVAIHRTLNGRGYGGTPDGIWRLRKTVKGLFAFDYKTRAFDSNHGAYPDEAAQVAAGVNAEYMIVSDGNGGAKRARLPELDGGMIVSIKPDGARVYPVNLEAGMRDFTELHARWVLSKSNRPKSIGRVWPVVRAPEVTGADVLAKIASAQSADELYALYRAHGSVWTDQHTAAAAARKAERGSACAQNRTARAVHLRGHGWRVHTSTTDRELPGPGGGWGGEGTRGARGGRWRGLPVARTGREGGAGAACLFGT